MADYGNEMQDGGLDPKDAELEAEVRGLVSQGQKIAAIKRLREATGWSLLEAMTWIDQPSAAGEIRMQRIATPCPHCGHPLRTDKAKQCFHCGSDWHQATNLVW
jgi:hypothetical protein